MGKKTGNTAEIVRQIVLPVCDEMGLVLWDVTFEKEGAEWFLKVLVEKAEGDIDILECEAFSRRIDPLIDEADPIDQSYYLEVGSPGLGRKLRLPEHFNKYIGQKVNVRLIRPDESGRKEIEATLLGFENTVISLEGEENKISLADCAFVKLCDDNI